MAQTLAQVQAYLAELYAARSALLTGKSYTIGTRTLTRVNENWLTSEISRYENKEAQLERGTSGMRTRRALPVDF
jgi:hypothetical protein